MHFDLNQYLFSEQAHIISGFVLKEEVTLEKAYSAGLSRDQLEYQRVQDKSETIERLPTWLEYYSTDYSSLTV